MTDSLNRTSNWTLSATAVQVLQALAIAALGLAVYYPSLSGTFFWDDYSLVHGRLLEQPILHIWRYPPAIPLEEHYWPVTYTVFWVLRSLFGYDPLPFRLTNILLHTVNSLLVWRLLLTLRSRGAWFAAMLFAAHPVHVESVAWIIELKDVLSGFFFLLATVLFLRASGARAKASEIISYVAAGLCYAFAVLSKTVAVGWPLMILLLVWTDFPREQRQRSILATLSILLVGLILLGLDFWVAHGSAHATPKLPLADRVELVGRAFWWYVGKLIWPTPLLALYPKWTLGEGGIFRFAETAVLAMAAAVILLLAWKAPAAKKLVFWSGWYFVLLAPTLGFVAHSFMLHSYVADRYQYLASVGPMTLFAAGVAWLWERCAGGRFQRLLLAGGAAVLLIHYSGLCLVHASLYAQPEKLLRHTLAHNAENANLHTMLGAMLAQKGALDDAAEHFRRAKQIAPAELAPRVNLSVVNWQRGAMEEALEETSAVLAVEPERALMWAIRAASLARIGEELEARQAARRALELDPDQELAAKVLRGEITTAPLSR